MSRTKILPLQEMLGTVDYPPFPAAEDEDEEALGIRRRKSNRIRKIRKMSTNEATIPPVSSSMGDRRKRAKLPSKCKSNPLPPLVDGKSFSCDRCKSSQIAHHHAGKKVKQNPSPRDRIDPVTNKLLTLCNACALAKPVSPKQATKRRISGTGANSGPKLEEKERYLEEARRFASVLGDGLGDIDARRLYCPNFKLHGCGCLQRFIKSDSRVEESRSRALHLLRLLKEGRHLAQQKVYELGPETGRPRVRCRNGGIGLGNGQKRSRAFEAFVLRERTNLREVYQLCERAAQQVLGYSNNFLHKRLRTEPGRGPRAPRRRGRAALGLLPPVAELVQLHCCSEGCVSIATSHSKLLQQWRDRAGMGQAEARRVIAEMLTPAGGVVSNCYRFITMVTGCSHSTICRVNEQMKKTGGDREPPEHGLKQWWKDHPRPKNRSDTAEEMQYEEVTSSVGENPSPGDGNLTLCSNTNNNSPADGSAELQVTRQQVSVLQRQVAEQQIQIQRQQQIIQQQLLVQQNFQLQQVLQQVIQASTIGVGPSDNNNHYTQRSILQKPDQLLQPIVIDGISCGETGHNDKDSEVPNRISDPLTSDYANTTTPLGGIHITLQPSMPVSEGATCNVEQINSNSTTSGFPNLLFIDPSSIIISGSLLDNQQVIGSSNTFPTNIGLDLQNNQGNFTMSAAGAISNNPSVGFS